LKKTAWLIFFLFLAVSCLDDPECYRLNNSIVGFTYKTMGSGSNTTLTFSGITADSAAAGTVFSPNFSGAVFTIPVDYFYQRTEFTFTDVNGAGNTKKVLLGYTSKAQFVAEDCGSRFVVSGLKILSHDFDSMRVVHRSPGIDSRARNIEIYRCPTPHNTNIAFFQLYDRTKPSAALKRTFQQITANFPTGSISPVNDATSATLPLNLENDSLKYTIVEGGLTKELSLTYKLNVEARYRPCGVQTFIESIKATGTFDSVNIMRNQLGSLVDFAGDPVQTNVRIYKCPLTNQMQIAFKKPATTGTTTVANSVLIKTIRADYTTDVFYTNATVNAVVLPLNPLSDNTTFTIEYADGTIDTINLSYTRRDYQIFRACGRQTVFSRLKEAIDLPNVTILRTDSVQYPAVTNLEIHSQ
jgi:hypothetical protein